MTINLEAYLFRSDNRSEVIILPAQIKKTPCKILSTIFPTHFADPNLLMKRCTIAMFLHSPKEACVSTRIVPGTIIISGGRFSN